MGLIPNSFSRALLLSGSAILLASAVEVKAQFISLSPSNTTTISLSSSGAPYVAPTPTPTPTPSPTVSPTPSPSPSPTASVATSLTYDQKQAIISQFQATQATDDAMVASAQSSDSASKNDFAAAKAASDALHAMVFQYSGGAYTITSSIYNSAYNYMVNAQNAKLNADRDAAACSAAAQAGVDATKKLIAAAQALPAETTIWVPKAQYMLQQFQTAVTPLVSDANSNDVAAASYAAHAVDDFNKIKTLYAYQQNQATNQSGSTTYNGGSGSTTSTGSTSTTSF